jgi:50S ribosomal subunit-associated GTPase HflX
VIFDQRPDNFDRVKTRRERDIKQEVAEMRRATNNKRETREENPTPEFEAMG